MLFAQLQPKTIWNAPVGSTGLWVMIILTFLVGIGLIFGLMAVPPTLRKYIVGAVTFLSGLFYVLFWLFPSPIDRQPDEKPRNIVESISFTISDAQPIVANLTNIISGFLIGLGVYSLLRIHLRRLAKRQPDWQFSVVLLISLAAMVLFGYWDWIDRQGPKGADLAIGAGWQIQQYGRDLLFDGVLQQMDAVMFSLVAFYILSAAYRAFRARSTEATILLVTALIVILGLMGAVEFVWNSQVTRLAGDNPNSFLLNFRLSDITQWIKDNVQTPSIRGIDFGVGIGLLAIGLRIWLGLEKTSAGDS